MDLATGYSLRNARECALLAQAAYDDPPTIECPEIDTQLIVRDVGNAIVIAFRGTKEIRDFLTDARFIRTRLVGGIQIHRGFHAAYEAIKDRLAILIHTMPHKPLFFTGHSLGGALAIIAAWDFAQRMFHADIHSVYTFGSPRVGNGTFKRRYNGLPIGPAKSLTVERPLLGQSTFCFVNGEDIVPRSPGWLMGYRRPGIDIFFSAFNRLEFSPSLWALGLSDVFGAVNGWVLERKLTLLTCHYMDDYIQQLKGCS